MEVFYATAPNTRIGYDGDFDHLNRLRDSQSNPFRAGSRTAVARGRTSTSDRMIRRADYCPVVPQSILYDTSSPPAREPARRWSRAKAYRLMALRWIERVDAGMVDSHSYRLFLRLESVVRSFELTTRRNYWIDK
jgi:hypothetical protein